MPMVLVLKAGNRGDIEQRPGLALRLADRATKLVWIVSARPRGSE
jgi:hypothetical protein